MIAGMAFFFHLFSAVPLYAEIKPQYDWFWLFYEKDIQPRYNADVYRPFYMAHKDKKGIFDASLMPVIFWRYRNDTKEVWYSLFGFMSASSYTHSSDNSKDFDIGIFPLLFFGNSPDKKDAYLLLWPFGGTLKGKFGVEKISAYVFPGLLLFVFLPPPAIISWQTLVYIVASLIPLYSRYEHKGFIGNAILWPFIYWGEGPARKEFRMLPFYAHLHKDGWYDKYNVLLLFNYQRYYYRNDEHRTFLFFPLFGWKSSRSGDVGAVTVIWPFFSWGYNKRIGDRSFNLPWPFVQVQDCREPKIVKRIFFPFYGYSRQNRSKTIFVTPLYFRLKRVSDSLTSDYFIVSFIFWYFKRDYREADEYYGRKWRYFKMWPLFHAGYNDMNQFSFNFLSLLPFRDPDGYEKMYQPFWTIVEFHRFRTGEKRLGLFFRLYYQAWGDSFIKVQIPFVISIEKRENRLTELHFLLYMFGYKHTKKGRYLNFFWVPIRLGDADPEVFAGLDDVKIDYNRGVPEEHFSCYARNGEYPNLIQISNPMF